MSFKKNTAKPVPKWHTERFTPDEWENVEACWDRMVTEEAVVYGPNRNNIQNVNTLVNRLKKVD